MTLTPIPAPIAVALILLAHLLADESDHEVRVSVDVFAGQCQISLSRESSQSEYRKAQAECRLTGMQTVYVVR